jgi:glycosyltransferase involved in cell wall biosynthesis
LNILYLSTLCSEEKFKEIYHSSKVKPQQQAQKFHHLITQGFFKHGHSLSIFSRLPINLTNSNKTKKSKNSESSYRLMFNYLKFHNFFLFKHFYFFVQTFFFTLKWILKNKKDMVIISDILNLSITIPALILSKIFRIKNVAIVTDVPNQLFPKFQLKDKLLNLQYIQYMFLSNLFIKSYGYYVFLTNQMNILINKKGKPYVIIEGLVDENMISITNSLPQKYITPIIMYTGALDKKYGIQVLLEAFMRIKDKNVELWFYGSGDLKETIISYSLLNNKIKYLGIKENNFVVNEQIKVKLLVNPRPSKDEYTMYSFPSKNLEYMVSGTPVLTTKLPGMPEEYYKHVYLIDDESIPGLTKKLNQILCKPIIELHKKGLEAKKFVLEYKNNSLQSQKIIDLISN